MSQKSYRNGILKIIPRIIISLYIRYYLTGTSSQYEGEEWTCRWINGDPVGQDALIDCNDGQRSSVIVPDHRLPPRWLKHLTKRMFGNSAGKWDTIIVR